MTTVSHSLTTGEGARRTARWPRAIFLVGIALALLLAVWGGLMRMGWALPPLPAHIILAHGPLMVCAALASLVSLERAVGLQSRRQTWAFAVPALFVLGGISVVVVPFAPLGPALFTVASAGFVAANVVMVRAQPAVFTRVMALGAVLLLAANALWLVGLPIYRVVPLWMGFLALTIAGERLELGRVQRLSAMAVRLFTVCVVVVAVGGLLSVVWDDGYRVAGVGLALLAVWLLRFDIARKTVRAHGLPRFIGVSLLIGFVWLGIGGACMALDGLVTSGPTYDAMLHAVFVGFVFSMIFGHAPIILPALMGGTPALPRAAYALLFVFELAMIARVLGDGFASPALRQLGGLVTALVVPVFVVMLARATRAASRSATAQAAAATRAG